MLPSLNPVRPSPYLLYRGLVLTAPGNAGSSNARHCQGVLIHIDSGCADAVPKVAEDQGQRELRADYPRGETKSLMRYHS